LPEFKKAGRQGNLKLIVLKSAFAEGLTMGYKLLDQPVPGGVEIKADPILSTYY
jgi:hypothetical protein